MPSAGRPGRAVRTDPAARSATAADRVTSLFTAPRQQQRGPPCCSRDGSREGRAAHPGRPQQQQEGPRCSLREFARAWFGLDRPWPARTGHASRKRVNVHDRSDQSGKCDGSDPGLGAFKAKGAAGSGTRQHGCANRHPVSSVDSATHVARERVGRQGVGGRGVGGQEEWVDGSGRGSTGGWVAASVAV